MFVGMKNVENKRRESGNQEEASSHYLTMMSY
jgi:hypothetical protein